MIKIYSYGAKPPRKGADLIEKQMFLARQYQGDLVACERRLRAFEDLLIERSCPPEVVQAAKRATEAAAEIIATARRDRSTGAAPKFGESPKATAIAQAREVERAANLALWAAQKAAYKREEVKLAVEEARDAAAQARKALRGEYTERGLYWGTYQLAEMAFDDAAKKSRSEHVLPAFPHKETLAPRKLHACAEASSSASASTFRSPPPYSRQAEGRVGVQIQSTAPLDTEGLLACQDTRLRLQVHPISDKRKPGSIRSKKPWATASFRVGSEGRAPVWADIDLVLHRPLPPGQIKRAWILCRTVGPRQHWSVQFTVDDGREVPATPSPTEATAAVNLGWRNLPDGGIRVGYVVGRKASGQEEAFEVRLPPEVASKIAHADSLRSIIDRERDKMIAQLVAFASSPGASEPVRRALAHARDWKSRERLIDLRLRWTSPSSSEEAALLDALDAWIRQDRHLWFWEADERLKTTVLRRDHYRHIAARLARSYARVLVTDMDLHEMAKEVPAEEGARGQGVDARRTRVLAAPSVLRQALCDAFRKTGGFLKADGKDATCLCPECGTKSSEADIRRAVEVACGHCGVVRDQDEAHCRVLLARASSEVARADAQVLAATGDEGTSVPQTKVKTGRWTNRSRKGQEAEAIQEAAK